jgi:single-strand DNA-binding protein
VEDFPYVNEVLVVGRLSEVPVVKTLPSGDPIMMWRIIVDRPEEERRSSRKVVDTFNCATFDSRLFGSVEEWQADDMLEIRGTLRRRFWVGGGSSYEIIARQAVLSHREAPEGSHTPSTP